MTGKATSFMSDKQGTILKLFLGLVVAIFIGILITVYFVSKRSSPVFLDENGKPVNSQSQPANRY